MKVTIVNKGYTKFVNDYKVILELREKIAKEYKLNEAIKEANLKEFDKWLNKLTKKNGTTKY